MAHTGKCLLQDGRIEWKGMTAQDVYNFVPALTHPYPGAFTTFNGQNVYVWKVSRLDDQVKQTPGRIVTRRNDGMVVAVIDESVLVESIQPEGGDERQVANYLKRGDHLRLRNPLMRRTNWKDANYGCSNPTGTIATSTLSLT